MAQLPNIIICGDIMLDHNIYTTIEKLANEAPIPVFNKYREEYLLGGCGNVLKNINALGCNKIYIFSAVGSDANGSRLMNAINTLDINNHIRILDNYTTTTKQRFYCDNKVLFRCDSENTIVEQKPLEEIYFMDEIETILQKEHIDCIILSDYNKGVLHKENCQTIIKLANKYNVSTCVDPKNDYTKYIGCTLIKPNRKEAYNLFQVTPTASIEELHKKIFAVIGCTYSVITLAEKGITLYNGKEMMQESSTAYSIIDVTGAGDIVCSILAYFLASEKPLRQILQLATMIATKSIEYPGTYTLSKGDLDIQPSIKYIDRINIATLKLKYPNKKIVFTNGCFDLLHSGHIQLFKFCKENGDIVVVGLNSDESIKRLKGSSRPINSMQTRIDMLESIQYVDHVVVFHEDTPYTLLKDLQPHTLIKGGDYDVESIIGKEFAKETIVCNFKEGYSSTSIINRIRNNI